MGMVVHRGLAMRMKLLPLRQRDRGKVATMVTHVNFKLFVHVSHNDNQLNFDLTVTRLSMKQTLLPGPVRDESHTIFIEVVTVILLAVVTEVLCWGGGFDWL